MPHTCPPWICFTFDNRLRRIFHNPQKILGPYVQEGQTVLDLGAGKGYFAIPLVRLVGDKGLVIAADIHPAMLRGITKRALRAGVPARIRTHLSSEHALGLADEVDFVLMFWMLHETPDMARLLSEVRAVLKPGGRGLLVEPRLHVGHEMFEKMAAACVSAGFVPLERPRIALSRAVVLRKS